MIDLLVDLRHGANTYPAGMRISPSAIDMTPAQAERLVSAGAAVSVVVEEPGEAEVLKAAAASIGAAIDAAVKVAAGIEVDGKPDAEGMGDTAADAPADAAEAVAAKTSKKRG
ncbi:MAG: hypothetical protein CTY21_14125 [Methylomonas sp.]|nr:MAG: hypothetical protein CTY21_14125 [Methylomonas sp.]